MSSFCYTKIKERLTLTNKINSLGIEMLPCFYYTKRNIRCVISANSSRYNKYIRSSICYNILRPSTIDQARVDTKKKCLNDEEAKTTAILAEAATKLACL